MKYQKGFSILEVLISLSVGAFLLTGVLFTFTSMKNTAATTSTYGQLQENGRLAISILTDDLMRQGFWGGLAGNLTYSSLSSVPGGNVNDCIGEGLNNATFPQSVGHFRTIWGETAGSSDVLNCISNAKVNSDVIQMKRVISSVISAANKENNKFYLIANMNYGEIFEGVDDVPVMDYGNIWEYQHHVYYVREDTINGKSLPVLVQGTLKNTADFMDFEPIIDGIEMLRFSYGVDTDGDGVVNAYIPADNMPDNYWDNENGARILAVTMYVLVRDLYPDYQYENKSTYVLAGESVDFMDVSGNGDNYHRLLLTSTITLYNARTDSW